MASLSKQQTYRLLMKEKKAQVSSVPRINHPLAKYNSVGQLTCVICTLPIKSELLWQTHVQSKRHKENISSLKSQSQLLNKEKQLTPSTQSSSSVAPVADKDGFVKPSLPPARKRSHSSSSDDESSPVAVKKVKDETVNVMKTDGLPSDFFDSPITSDIPVTTPTKELDEKITEKEQDSKDVINKKNPDLPEGFFDDPIVDAKVRKVEYKDPLDEQWEAFQKTISKETDLSEAIIAVDDTDMQVDRELSEVNEQVHCFQRAESLRLKQETLSAAKNVKREPLDEAAGVPSIEEGDSEEETDLTDLLNWRFKSH